MINALKRQIFSVLIYEIESFLDQKEIEQILFFSKSFNYKHHNSLLGKSKTTYDEDRYFIDRFSLEKKHFNLKLKIENIIDYFSNDYGHDKLKITNSWVSYQYKGSELLEHKHPNSYVSGALYLKVDENSSKIYFHNPNPFVSFLNFKSETEYNYNHFCIKPKNGNLILFPSWLAHSSNGEKNESEERIVISFNTNLAN